MLLGEPAEDAEGVADHEKQVDDLVGQGARHEKLAQEYQRSNGGPHGGLQRWIGREILNSGWEMSPIGITGRPEFPWGAREPVIFPFHDACVITR